MAQQTRLLAFDRQNHMGASDGHAQTLSTAIQAEAEAMLAEKKVVSSAITIQENAVKMKARHAVGACFATQQKPMYPVHLYGKACVLVFTASLRPFVR